MSLNSPLDTEPVVDDYPTITGLTDNTRAAYSTDMLEAEALRCLKALSACRAELADIYAGQHALFDAAKLFEGYSTDGGATWQKYPIERRIALAIAVCKSEIEWEERAEQSERLLAAAQAGFDYLLVSTAPDGQWADQAVHSFVAALAGKNSPK